MPLYRRLWHIHVDERSREIEFTIGSKVYRARHEDGKFGGYLHYDLAVPYNQGKPLPGWSFSLPQKHKNVPFDGKLLRIDPPNAEPIYVCFFYEATGCPGSLFSELIATTGELGDAKEKRSRRSALAAQPHPERRSSEAV